MIRAVLCLTASFYGECGSVQCLLSKLTCHYHIQALNSDVIVAGSLFDSVRFSDLCRHSPVTQYVLKLVSYDLSTHVN